MRPVCPARAARIEGGPSNAIPWKVTLMSAPAQPRLRRVLLSLLAAMAVIGVPLAAASPAQAHDQLIGGSPKAGSAVDKAPEAITLTFSGELRDLENSKSNQIIVTNRDGDEVTEGAVTVKGTKLSRTLQPLPAGTYDVQWSALSSDGHRISGADYAFTVTKGEKAPASESSSEDLSSGAASSGSESKGAAATAGSAGSLAGESSAAAAPAASPAPTTAVIWLVAGFLVLALVLGVILQLTRKKTPREPREH